VIGFFAEEKFMEKFKSISDAMQFSSEKMKKNGLFETDRMFCDLYCFEPGQSQALHTHEGSDKIYFVVKGRGHFQVGEEEKELREQEIAIAPSGQRHGVNNPGSERLVLLVFMAPKPSH
jgi:mannose-6-phosphate isomerase-like protein (cupin superfamily)